MAEITGDDNPCDGTTVRLSQVQGCARFADNCVELQVFGRLCSVVF